MQNIENDLEFKLKQIQEILSQTTDQDYLLLLANVLLEKLDSYHKLDLNHGLLVHKIDLNPEDYYDVILQLESNPDSISLELCTIVHKFLYFANKITILEKTQYGS